MIEVVGLSLALAFVIPMINFVADKYEKSRAHERYEDIYAVGYLGNLYTEVNFSDTAMFSLESRKDSSPSTNSKGKK